MKITILAGALSLGLSTAAHAHSPAIPDTGCGVGATCSNSHATGGNASGGKAHSTATGGTATGGNASGGIASANGGAGGAGGSGGIASSHSESMGGAGGSGGIASANSGSSSASVSGMTTGDSSATLTFHEAAIPQPAANTAYAPPYAIGGGVCAYTPVSLGFMARAFGLSGGGAVIDKGCERRANADMLARLGHNDLACALLMNNREVADTAKRTGFHCEHH